MQHRKRGTHRRAALPAAVAAALIGAGCADEAELSTRAASEGKWRLQGRLVDPALHGAEMVALSTRGEVERARLGADGRIDLQVPGERTWVLHFVEGERFVATMYFPRKRAEPELTSLLPLPKARAASGTSSVTSALVADEAADAGSEDGAAAEPAAPDGSIDLGDVEVEGGIAAPENNPGDSVDSDGDGVPNSDDDDADGSGVPDSEEDAQAPDPAALGVFHVADVSPEPGARIGRMETLEIELSAPVGDGAEAAIRLLDASGADVPIRIELDGEGKILKVRHDEPFARGGAYELRIEGGLASAEGQELGVRFVAVYRVEGDEEGDADSEADSDGDSDADSEAEADSDAEAESDADSDADSEGDSEASAEAGHGEAEDEPDGHGDGGGDRGADGEEGEAAVDAGAESAGAARDANERAGAEDDAGV